MSRVRLVAPAVALALAACTPAPPRPAYPRAEFILEAGDSSFWVRSGPDGLRVRGAPIRLARLDGVFYELYLADDDHSYSDALITGQVLYRRNLTTGDSAIVFADTTLEGIGRWYARAHPADRALGPDDDLPEEPHVNASSDLVPLERFGRYLSVSYTASLQVTGSDDWHLARRWVVDLRSGRPATVADIVGDKNAAYALRRGAKLFAQTLDSVLASRDVRAREAASALGDFKFDPTSFELMSVEGETAIRFVAPGTGRRAEGLTLPLPPITVPAPSWWTESLAGLADPDTDPASDHWTHGNVRVVVTYSPDGESANAALADSAGRSWPLAGIPVPARRIFWLDRNAVDSATRAALARAFDEAALYSEDVRTAMTTPKPKAPALAGRPVHESQSETAELMMPGHANNLGHVFGGVILSMMDRTAAVAAIRHTRSSCVTVSVDRVDFKEPIHLGDLVTMKASVNFTGRTSMEVGVRVEAENLVDGVRRHTNSCYLTFVAVDRDGRPIPVPPIIPQTKPEQRRHAAAAERRRRRLEERAAESERA
jgi:acyl-CoA hydrolase